MTNPIILSSTPNTKEGQKIYFIMAFDNSFQFAEEDVEPHSTWLTIQDAEKELERLIQTFKHKSNKSFKIFEVQMAITPEEFNGHYRSNQRKPDHFVSWPSDEEIFSKEYRQLLKEKDSLDEEEKERILIEGINQNYCTFCGAQHVYCICASQDDTIATWDNYTNT